MTNFQTTAAKERSFTLVELLVVIAIIAILSAVAVPLIPSLMRANQLDSSISTLSGILEQARETAISSDTYVWVAFTDPPATSKVSGTWVVTFRSIDGTESPINTAVIPNWATAATIPGTNLQLLNKIQNLPGVQIAALTSLPTALANKASNLTPYGSLFASSWTVTPLQNTSAAGNSFTHALEFTPDGEMHSPQLPQINNKWYNYIIFGLVPSLGSTTSNDALFALSRLTGKATAYRQ